MAVNRVEILKNVYVLTMLLQDELEGIAAIATERELQSGEILFRQGEPANSMFIVTDGAVDIIRKAPDGSDKLMSSMGPGAVIGEMALVDLAPRSATGRARNRAWVLEIAYPDLESFFASRPEVAVKFFRSLVSILCKRLRSG